MSGPSRSWALGAGTSGTPIAPQCVLALEGGLVLQVDGQARLQQLERLLRRVGKLEEVEVLPRDGALLREDMSG
jgi:hypothetical protein